MPILTRKTEEKRLFQNHPFESQESHVIQRDTMIIGFALFLLFLQHFGLERVPMKDGWLCRHDRHDNFSLLWLRRDYNFSRLAVSQQKRGPNERTP